MTSDIVPSDNGEQLVHERNISRGGESELVSLLEKSADKLNQARPTADARTNARATNGSRRRLRGSLYEFAQGGSAANKRQGVKPSAAIMTATDNEKQTIGMLASYPAINESFSNGGQRDVGRESNRCCELENSLQCDNQDNGDSPAIFNSTKSNTTSGSNNSSSTTSKQASTKKAQKPRRRVATMSQRRAANIRERRRMYNLNSAFDRLRKKVPSFAYEKRLSRIESLKLAIMYIKFMDNLVTDDAYAEKYKKLTANTSVAAASSGFLSAGAYLSIYGHCDSSSPVLAQPPPPPPQLSAPLLPQTSSAQQTTQPQPVTGSGRKGKSTTILVGRNVKGSSACKQPIFSAKSSTNSTVDETSLLQNNGHTIVANNSNQIEPNYSRQPASTKVCCQDGNQYSQYRVKSLQSPSLGFCQSPTPSTVATCHSSNSAGPITGSNSSGDYSSSNSTSPLDYNVHQARTGGVETTPCSTFVGLSSSNEPLRPMSGTNSQYHRAHIISSSSSSSSSSSTSSSSHLHEYSSPIGGCDSHCHTSLTAYYAKGTNTTTPTFDTNNYNDRSQYYNHANPQLDSHPNYTTVQFPAHTNHQNHRHSYPFVSSAKDGANDFITTHPASQQSARSHRDQYLNHANHSQQASAAVTHSVGYSLHSLEAR